jgi:hypothetical protein
MLASHLKHDMKKCQVKIKKSILITIKMVNSKVLVPDKYILIGCRNIRVPESFSIPPKGHDNQENLESSSKLKYVKNNKASEHTILLVSGRLHG